MLTLLYINGGLHVYDTTKMRFVKSNAANVARALDAQRQRVGSQWRPSRAVLLRRAVWVREERQGKPYYRACRAEEAEALMNSRDNWLTLHHLRRQNGRLS